MFENGFHLWYYTGKENFVNHPVPFTRRYEAVRLSGLTTCYSKKNGLALYGEIE